MPKEEKLGGKKLNAEETFHLTLFILWEFLPT